ncbi:MAG: hypothetical protein JWN37_570 [Candidatus Nomurabacteria bacterium]|nr:hypothetical protein [Candidatus Nomurabacteria bacterium]
MTSLEQVVAEERKRLEAEFPKFLADINGSQDYYSMYVLAQALVKAKKGEAQAAIVGEVKDFDGTSRTITVEEERRLWRLANTLSGESMVQSHIDFL